MKLSVASVVACVLIGAAGISASAQTAAPSSSPMVKGPASTAGTEDQRAYAEEFRKYLHSHPGTEGDLIRDPSLVRDKAYIDAHPKLKEYLEAHPKLAEEFKSHPSDFMRMVHRTEGGHGPY